MFDTMLLVECTRKTRVRKKDPIYNSSLKDLIFHSG